MADVVENLSAEHLISLLSQQRALYEKLRGLADRQQTVIASDRPEQLLEVLRERQTIVGQLAQLNLALAPYRRNWGATYGELPAAERAKAGALLDEINGMLQVILKADREDSALLGARKRAVALELGELSGGRVANAAYARQAQAGSRGPGADITG